MRSFCGEQIGHRIAVETKNVVVNGAVNDMKLAGEHKRYRESRHSRGRNRCGIKVAPSASRLAKRTPRALAGGLCYLAEGFGAIFNTADMQKEG